MSEFFHMGGYGFYVWTSYGIFAVVLIWTAAVPVIRRRSVIQRLQDRAAREKRSNDTNT